MKNFFLFSFLVLTASVLSAQSKFLKHKVKQGETISTIAQKYDADKNYILMLNDFPANVKLTPGDVVLIRELKPGETQVMESRDFIESSPSSYTAPATKVERAAEPKAEKLSEPKSEVKKVEKALTAAPTSDPNAGANAQAGDAVNFNGVVYTVSDDGYHTFERGQTLYRLSVIYKTPVDKIKALNGLTSNNVPVGTKLKVK